MARGNLNNTDPFATAGVEGAESESPLDDMMDVMIGNGSMPFKGSRRRVADNALVPQGDGTLSYGDVQLTRVGIENVNDLSRDQWDHLLRLLASASESMNWWVGDLFASGEKKGYGKATELAPIYGYEPPTVYNCTWVAGAVEISLRREVLSFGHHKLVASKLPEEQQYWLQRAEDEGLSVHKLDAAMNGKKGDSVDYAMMLKRFTSGANKAMKLPPQDRQKLAQNLREIADELEVG